MRFVVLGAFSVGVRVAVLATLSHGGGDVYIPLGRTGERHEPSDHGYVGDVSVGERNGETGADAVVVGLFRGKPAQDEGIPATALPTVVVDTDSGDLSAWVVFNGHPMERAHKRLSDPAKTCRSIRPAIRHREGNVLFAGVERSCRRRMSTAQAARSKAGVTYFSS